MGNAIHAMRVVANLSSNRKESHWPATREIDWPIAVERITFAGIAQQPRRTMATNLRQWEIREGVRAGDTQKREADVIQCDEL